MPTRQNEDGSWSSWERDYGRWVALAALVVFLVSCAVALIGFVGWAVTS